ncbi:integrator complex subunit 15-like [Ornithodoros turicata]|uniref:Uncharacterized protein n=1 Tax=Ornithodoros turicata TaxID=34597 RepID=A0A2R5LCX7_9ACAR
MTDVRASLRKIEFPAVVYEALRQMQKLLTNEARSPTYAHVAKEISDEFIFNDCDRRGNPRRRKLSAVRELQIIEVIASTLQSTKPDMCQKIFFILFPTADPTVMESRITIISRLVSLAIALKSQNTLNCAGFWMHVCGCTSELSLTVVQHVVGDYFNLIPTSADRMKELAGISPLFCASMATSLTHMTQANPAVEVIELLATWVRAQPFLCFTPMEAIPPQLYTQCLQTFLPGLMTWCVLAPVTASHSNLSPEMLAKQNELYSYLHYALLEMLIRASQVTPRAPMVLTFLPTLYVLQVADTLKRIANPNAKSTELALNRLGQILQAAFTSKCIHGNMDAMFQMLKQLPPNRLLRIILSRWETKKY